jgi:hypothetical protein
MSRGTAQGSLSHHGHILAKKVPKWESCTLHESAMCVEKESSLLSAKMRMAVKSN